MSKKIVSILLMGLCVGTVAGCGTDNATIAQIANISESLEAMAPSAESELPQKQEHSEFQEYEMRLSKGEFLAEDYLAFGELCKEKGQVRRQRDLLEQCVRLFDDRTAYERLQEIQVNLEEETDEILEEAKLLVQNLELEEFVPEAINQVVNPVWFETMMPKMYEGKRSYFLMAENRIELMLQVGYDEEGARVCGIWYLAEDGQTKVIELEGNILRYLETGVGETGYEGNFEAWTLDGNSGDVLKERGTLADGRYVDEYTIEVHMGEAATDLFSLWSHKEGMEYVSYTGSFDAEGKTLVKQPSDKIRQSLVKDSQAVDCLVYAYDEEGKKCLYTELADANAKDTYTYSLEVFGWEAYPVMMTYSVERTTEAEVSPEQIRIYDGMLQWLDGEKWVDAGTVESYLKKDPFRTYAEKEEDESEEAGGEDSEKITRPSGSVEEQSKKPATVKKPTTTTKPAVTTKPSTTVTKPTPAPEPEEDDDDEPVSAPEPEPAPEPAPEPEPSPGGGDVDVEWTDDIL